MMRSAANRRYSDQNQRRGRHRKPELTISDNMPAETTTSATTSG
jgi:hypothetical protein